MGAEPAEYKKITPDHLLPAVEHIREVFETRRWKYSAITTELGYAALHPEFADLASLSDHQDAFKVYCQMIGHRAEMEFDDLLERRIPPSIFRAYFDVYYEGLKINVRDQFNEMLEIGLVNSEALKQHPVEWAKSQLSFLLKKCVPSVERWLKEICDTQEVPAPKLIAREFEEVVFWKKWRAPRLIHMQPAGNTQYDAATAWTREDELRTQQLLDVRARRFIEFLDIALEKMAGDAHVRVAQNPEHNRLRRQSQSGTASDVLSHRLVQGEGSRDEARLVKSTKKAPSEEIQRRAVIKKVRNPEVPPIAASNGNWEDLEISFLSDDRVQIHMGKMHPTLNYADFGFQDDRTENPNGAWRALIRFAELDGLIRDGTQARLPWKKLEKRVQEIRRVFRKHFGISLDPIPYVEGIGYRARFKIRCGRSFRT